MSYTYFFVVFFFLLMTQEAIKSTITIATLTLIVLIIHVLWSSLKLDAITIFAVVLSRDASKAPPVGFSSWIQTTLSGACLLSLAIFKMKELFHWPSVIDTFPDVGHIRSRLSDESLTYSDHSTVMSPCEPLDLRTGISSLVTFILRETSRCPFVL